MGFGVLAISSFPSFATYTKYATLKSFLISLGFTFPILKIKVIVKIKYDNVCKHLA